MRPIKKERLELLKTKREKLAARLKALDEQIARIERAAREQESRAILKLLQSRGITASQLAALLDKSPTAPRTAGGSETQK
jgi:DNA-binding protein H-NS